MRTNLEVHRTAHPDPNTWIVFFPWPTNPLPMNGSYGHWRSHSKKARAVLDEAISMIRYARIPALGMCRAQVTWWVEKNRVRDVDNLADLEKRLFDALVRVDVVADDRPELMDKPRAVIRHINDSDGMITMTGFTLTVTRIAAVTA